MNSVLEIPPVENVINPEFEQRIGLQASKYIGEEYGQYEEHLRQNLTHEQGTLLPNEVILKAAGIPKPEDPVCVLDALYDAKTQIRKDYIQRRDGLLEHNIDIEPIAKLSLIIGDGTERNLVHYYAEQALQARGSELTAFMDGLRRWTTQEQAHSPIIVHVAEGAGLYDERKMASIQNALIKGGIDVTTTSYPATSAFTQPQEMLTYFHHRITGLILGGAGRGAMQQVAGQEMAHKEMFKASNKVYFNKLDQATRDYAMCIAASVMRHFDMPASKSFQGYELISVKLSSAGVFTREMIVESFSEYAHSLGLLDMEVQSEEAKIAQTNIRELIDINSPFNQEICKAQERFRSRYKKNAQKVGRIPFVIGETVTFDNTGDYKVHALAS